ncbi:hypothetical protein CVT26_008539 [Gymnopilus dilepis]|uniref:IMD domain-containing protein n=1 Tax=Gymnopilus dilepis TaxID=231916 RepID=A0A409XXR6_9AGAR|nr:hypothetical protein CVT26_008539 [Gymnopilus dilepis]
MASRRTPGRSFSALAFGSSKRPTSPGPPSPTFSEATQASAMNFGPNGPHKIITRQNLKASLQAYEDLVNTCTAYRAALMTLSKATAAFADAMGRCSGLKGPTYEAGTRLQAASGVHHLMSNLWHVLSESLDKNFERPLRDDLEKYRTTVNERSQNYERLLHEKSRVIRQTEMRSMNRKERNLQHFREALAILQRQVDELDELKSSHYQEILEHEEEVWDNVQNKICLVVRSEMDVFDRITSKVSDPVIEPMLQAVPDPFDAYGPPQSEDQIFSILSPLSIMTTTTPATGSPRTSTTPERDLVDLPSATTKIATWLPGTNGVTYTPESAEWAKVPSPSQTPPRSTSPSVSTSPPTPSRRHSVPPPHRINESKLRSVLSVIDEDKVRIEDQRPETGEPSPQAHLTTPHLDLNTNTHVVWNTAYGQSPYYAAVGEAGQSTPRNSSPSQSSQSHPDSPSTIGLERHGPGEDQVSITS